ncbi:MAG: response regulator transcription factor [Chloroflexi bacterium]|nr:response regulator transcription factor [Chloroflexota bacterium]
MASPTVLVIEDEENLLQALRYNLSREGYQVTTAQDGERGLETARSIRPDLVILDVMLPRMDGFDVCRILRKESTVPILMLTARDEEIDRVVGLELGADDYVPKPFSMRELMARVKAMLRRSRMAPEALANDLPKVLRSGDLEIDLTSHIARLDNQTLDLKPKEFDLIALLVAHPGRAFTREQILQQLWGYDYVGDTRTVDVHIRWLREKIEEDASHPTRIITIRGVGYRFEG